MNRTQKDIKALSDYLNLKKQVHVVHIFRGLIEFCFGMAVALLANLAVLRVDVFTLALCCTFISLQNDQNKN